MVRNKLIITFLAIISSVTVFAAIGARLYAADTPSYQANADKSPVPESISDKLSTCIGADGYGSLGMTVQYQNCVVLQCRILNTLQYRDRCLKEGFNLHSCKGIADPTQTEAAYLGCVKSMADKCNALGDSAVDGSTPKDRCSEAAAWYVSRYSNSADPSYGAIGHGTAYLEYLPLLKGELDLVQSVDFVREVRGQSPLNPDEEEIDDAAGSQDEEGAQAGDPEAEDSIESSLDCTINGQPGIKTSIPIVGSDSCIPKGDGSIESNPILELMRLVLQVASAGAGLVVAVMIIVAGIQYASAQGNPQLIQAAKQRLMNAIIGLIMYIFAFGLLNYLVPGSLIG